MERNNPPIGVPNGNGIDGSTITDADSRDIEATALHHHLKVANP
jgi:hypothetical protein